MQKTYQYAEDTQLYHALSSPSKVTAENLSPQMNEFSKLKLNPNKMQIPLVG